MLSKLTTHIKLLLSMLVLSGLGTHAQQLESPPLLWGNLNQTSSIGFDYSGSPIAKGRSFFNSLGKATQTRSWDVLTDDVWASQVFYDRHGRPALQTLSAPMGATFQFLDIFATDMGGNPYDLTNFDLPGNVDNPDPINPNSFLGNYYSAGNTQNPYQDVTSYPFSRTVYSELNPGSVLKVLGGNKINGEWKQSYSFSMPAGGALSSAGAFGASFNTGTTVMKTVMRDVHGVDVVVFRDTDGQVLAAARSGGTCAQTLTGGGVSCTNVSFEIGRQGFVDIHIPVGVNDFTVGNPVLGESGLLDVYNLITEEDIGTMANGTKTLPSGFYRISVSTPYAYNEYIEDGGVQRVSVSHKVNYYDYSLNQYDEAGRLTSTKQPLNHLPTAFDYNSLGQLLQTENPDQGLAMFLYRKDGQIRFSFSGNGNALEQEVAYTNYDQYGRPIESGLFYYRQAGHDNTYLESIIDQPDGLDDAFCVEVNKVLYDMPDKQFPAKLQQCGLNPQDYRQTFVAGNVSKTWTEDPATTTTWYSYDVRGRLKWMIQEIPGLNCLKTIDYTYDPVTGQVTSVDYQRYMPSERFVHHYAYNSAGQLVQVFTTTDGNPDGSTFEMQANYLYNESGQLVRTILGDNLQGIDYVYNLNGQLKAINHPSLIPGNDPGKDGTPASNIPADVFGMALDYYDGDYARTNTPTPVAQQNTTGINQYNGNIKAMRFNTQGLASAGQFNTYLYGYNKNNWLQGAVFGSGGISPIAGNMHSVSFAPNPQGDYLVSGISYDPNGNILSLARKGYTDASGTNAMDDFTYHYSGYDNQLQYVDDAGDNPDPTRYDDLRDQPPGNYVYNTRGQLVQNIQEGLAYSYYVTGQVEEVQKNGVPLVKFFYNDRGQRVGKETFQGGGLLLTTFYVRDAAGSVMAVYNKDKYGVVKLTEHPVYGLSRLGVYYRPANTYAYQLADHLGNVRAVVVDAGGTAVSITNKADYYPFGMPMPKRHVDGGYRYAFQGQEKDDETGMEAFQLRLWDARIGRWLTPDPAREFVSPYIGMGNNPIYYVDFAGDTIRPYNKKDAIGVNKYKAWLAKNHPSLFNFLENHPVDIFITFKDNLGSNRGRRNGNTTVSYSMVDKRFKELRIGEVVKLSGEDRYVAGVFSFKYRDKTRDENGMYRSTIPINLNYSEAKKIFNEELDFSINSILIEIRSGANYSTGNHELGHAEFALKNPFEFFTWSLIESMFFNPNGKGHYPNNPSGMNANQRGKEVFRSPRYF